MSKKQIKELVIQTSSKGTREVLNEVASLNEALKGAVTASDALTGSLKGGAKYIGQVATAYANVTKSINGSVDAVRKLNTALNGDTKKATQSISAYLDNLQILNLELNSTSISANKAANALGRMASVSQLDKVISLLEDLTSETVHVVVGLEQLNNTMNKIETNTGKASARLKQARDNISEVGMFANRTNEELDGLGKTIGKAGEKTDKTKRNTDLYNNSLRRLNETGSSSARSFSKLAFGMNPLVSTYAAIAVNVYALTEAFRLLKDASALARLEEQTANFAASVSGVNVKGLARDLQALAGGALDSAEALKQAVRGISFGFSPELLRQLTEGARKASVALGRDFTDSMDRVIRGISKGEVELLDELGVVTRLETAFKDYARTAGLEADKLTDSQRKLALAQEVNLQLADKYSSFSTASSAMERLGTATTDASNAILKDLSAALEPAADTLAGWITGLRYTNDAQRKAAESYEIYQKAIEQNNTFQAAVALAEYTEQMELAYRQTIKGTKEYKANTAAIQNQQNQLASLKQVIGGVTIALGALAASKAIAAIPAIIAGFRTLAVVLATVRAAALGLAAPMAAATAPLWASVAAVGALVAAGYSLGMVLISLKNSFISGESFATEFGKTMSTAKGQLQELLESVGESVTGLADFDKASEDARYSTVAMAIATKEYNQAVKEGRTLDADKAKAAMQYLKDSKDSAVAASDLAKAMSRQKTDAENLYASLYQLSKVNLDVLADPKKFKELETTFENLKSSGVLAKGLSFDGGKGFAEASDAAKRLSDDYKILVESQEASLKISSIQNSGKKEEDLLNVTAELEAVNARLISQDSLRGTLSSKLTEEEVKQLQNKQWELMATKSQLETEYAREAVLRNIAVESAKAQAIAELDGASKSKLLEIERQTLETKKAAMGDKDTTEISQAIQLLDIDIEREKILENRASRLTAIETAQTIAMDNLTARNHLESEAIELKITQLQADIIRAGITKAEKEALAAQISILQNKLAITKELETLESARSKKELELSALERNTAKAGSESARVNALDLELKKKQEIYSIDLASGKLSEAEKAKRAQDLAFEQASLAGMKDGASFKDASNIMGNIAGLEGLTDLQSTFAGSMSGISDTYSKFLTDMEGKGGSFMDYLTNNIDGMSNVLSSSLSLAQAAFSQISDAKIASIDAEIEAEKRRDGKSEESLAKIKKLQAQKIKEETKAKKASVIMSTATAVMQAFAQMGPLGAPFAAALGAMGMLQLATIDKAASGQLAGLNSGSANLSISGGNRSNEIDVSRKANAGELAYLQGVTGTGTAGNFTPGKAIGGYSSAGTSIVVGESGPEVITPAVPVNVTPAGQAGSSVQITLSPVFNTSTIDSSGFEQLTQRFSRELYDGLERELRARNRTLDNL